MALKIKTLDAVTATLADTAYPLSSVDEKPYVSITVSADSANSDSVYIGDSTVTSANGTEIIPGGSATLTTPIRKDGNEEFHLTDIYITSPTGGSIVRIIGWVRR